MGQNKRYGDPLTALDPTAVPPPADDRVHHVYVNVSRLKRAPAEYPGLLIDWRRTTRGWEAQVVYVTEVGGTAVLWCAADQLRPAW